VASTSAQAEGSASISLERPAAVRPGDLLVASIEARGSPSINGPDGWQRVRADKVGTTVSLATYIRVAGAVEPATYTWVLSDPEAVVAILVAVRDAGSDPIDDANGRADPKRASILAPDGFAHQDASLVLAIFGAARATTITPPTGMTELAELASASGRYKATLEIAAGSAADGAIDGLVAPASGRSATVSHLLVIRP
jgi:hypothetical protein